MSLTKSTMEMTQIIDQRDGRKADKVTICVECGKEVIYTRKKPEYCPECREKKFGSRRFYMPPKRGAIIRSHGENLMRVLLDSIFSEKVMYIDGGYYSFLSSPKGNEMQLDRYYPYLGLAFEYQGQQHFEDNEYFFKDKDAFEFLQECDKRKVEQCNELGIVLITIAYNENLSIGLIYKKLMEAGMYYPLQPYLDSIEQAGQI